MPAKIALLAGLLVIFMAATVAPTPVVHASPFTVNTTTDSGPGSLRQAIIDANADVATPHTITLSVTGTINLTSALPAISRNVNITGPGVSSLTLNLNGTTLSVATATTVGLSGFTVFGGNPSAIDVATGATLNLNQMTVTGNAANGIANTGILNVTSSNISFSNTGIINNNNATATILRSSVAWNGTGISNVAGGTVNVINSTVSSNLGVGISSAGTVNLTSATIAYNNGNVANTGTATFKNTIVSNALGSNCSGGGTFTSTGNNLSSDATCNFVQGTDLASNTGANLDFLWPNDVFTFTHRLLPGSTAIDRGDQTACAASANTLTDQRNFARTDGNGDTTVVCDIGSYEAAAGSGSGGTTAGVTVTGPNVLSCGTTGTYTVTVTTTGGAAVSNASITWTSLGGTVNPVTGVTAANGTASTVFTATTVGSGLGRVTATVTGGGLSGSSNYIAIQVNCGTTTNTCTNYGYGGYTTLTQQAIAGATMVSVASNNGLNVGDQVSINAFTATQEIKFIAASSAGFLTFTTPLAYSHNVGEAIYNFNVNAYGSGYNCYGTNNCWVGTTYVCGTGYNNNYNQNCLLYPSTCYGGAGYGGSGYYDTNTLAALAAQYASSLTTAATNAYTNYTTNTTASTTAMQTLAQQVAAQNAAAAAARPPTTTTTAPVAPVSPPPASTAALGIRPPNTGDAGLAAD